MIELPNEAAMRKLAACIARVARVGDVIGLTGSLGIGKTVFARAFIRALTHDDQVVPSPTYTLMQRYEGPQIAIYHFDLYRVESDGEVQELGIDEAMANGVSLIEWPAKAALPRTANRLDIRIEETTPALPEKRCVKFETAPAWEERLQSALHAYAETASANC